MVVNKNSLAKKSGPNCIFTLMGGQTKYPWAIRIKSKQGLTTAEV